MKALVLIPTHNHGRTVQTALAFLTQQTYRNFDAVVMGDGVPEVLRGDVERAVLADSRVQARFFPKHERRGEPYRDQMIRESNADVVCYLTDRDIWFEDHLATMIELLSTADYAHSLGVHVLPKGDLRGYACDLSQPGYKHMLQTTNDNRIPFSTFGHTRRAYLALEEGWATTPAGEWTDLFMIRKFLRNETLNGISGSLPTAITFPSPPRIDWTMQQRCDELERWTLAMQSEQERSRIRNAMFATALNSQRAETAQLAALIATRFASQRTAPILQAPSFGALNQYRA